jgi:predicted RNase H-like HicB family nuclease
MKVTIFTHRIPSNPYRKDLSSRLATLQYVANCAIKGESLNSSGKTREEAIENLKTLIELRYPDLEQVEVDLPLLSEEEEGTHLKSDCRHLTQDLEEWSSPLTESQRQALEELALAIKAILL